VGSCPRSSQDRTPNPTPGVASAARIQGRRLWSADSRGVDGVTRFRARRARRGPRGRPHCDSSATTQELGANGEEVLDAVRTRLDLSRTEAADAYGLAEQFEDTPRSIWGYVQGLTRRRQHTPWQDQRFALDRAASRLLILAIGQGPGLHTRSGRKVMSGSDNQNQFAEPHSTIAELADMWKFSTEFVRQIVRGEPGVTECVRQQPGRRRYRVIRVPASVVERVYRRALTRAEQESAPARRFRVANLRASRRQVAPRPTRGATRGIAGR
jgi:hypothetical protein